MREGGPQRERVHLLLFIFVTAPVFHLDTSLLNADAPQNTAREGATKKRKDQPTTNNNKSYRFRNTITKRTKTCENGDSMKLELSYIQNAQQRKVWPQREEARVHLLPIISVTAPVFHLDTS